MVVHIHTFIYDTTLHLSIVEKTSLIHLAGLFQAMRILEGLKSRPNSYRFPPTTPTGGSGKSMFVASLSASQELPPDAGTVYVCVMMIMIASA